jgi:hypothetical protein
MPTWTLHYANDLDERILARHHYALAQQDMGPPSGRITDVHLEETSTNGAYRLRITTHEDRPVSDELWQAILVRQEFTTRRLVGFDRIIAEPNRNGDQIPNEVREQIIRQYVATSEGRTRLAQSMVAPLRARMDYQSIARRAFMVEQLPDGALPIYDRDPDVADLIVPSPWVQPGAWVCTETGFFAKIVSFDGKTVEFVIWRDTGILSVSLLHFVRTCKPCEEPKEGPTWYERLEDGVDNLGESSEVQR